MFSQEINDLSDSPIVKLMAGRNDIHGLQVDLDLSAAFPNVNMWRIMIVWINPNVESILLSMQDCDQDSSST